MKTKHKARIAGYDVVCSPGGTLWVTGGKTAQVSLSVLPRGTHAALDQLGPPAKREIVRWWKKARRGA